MNTITKLEIQKNDKNRVNLFLDNSFCCSILLETCVKNNLKVGTIITEERLAEIQAQSEKETAYTKVLKLISTRFKTQKEVERYLKQKGYLPATIYYVISKLNEYHVIDDRQFAKSFANTHKTTFGKLKIKNALMLRGVSESIIDEILADEDFDQTAEIQKLAEKYMKSKADTPENFAKLFKYLIGKGFEYEKIKSALKKEFEWWNVGLIS